MTFVWSAVLKDLKRRARQPWVLLLWLGIPLVVGTLMTFITGGGGGVEPVAHLLVADQDDSLLSGLVVSFFGQGELGELVRVEPAPEQAGRRRIADDDGSALLIIPPGFQTAVLNETETQLKLVTNPAQQILPAIVQESLSLLVDAAFYLHGAFGPEIAQVADLLGEGAPADETVARLSVQINEAMDQLAAYLFPPLIALETSVRQRPGPALDVALLFFPGILVMALLFTAQGLSEDFWHERELGTLRRLASAPQSLTRFLGAKLLYAALVLGGIALLLLLLGFAYHGISPAKLPLAWLWLVTAGAVFYLLFGLAQLWAPSHRAGSLLTSLVVFPLMMVGGSFFPFETMPGWMVAVGRWTPNGLVLRGLKEYLFGTFAPLGMATAFAALALTGIVVFALIASRHRTTFARS